MSNVVVLDNVEIRQDAEGRYCLNDLHKAAGGEAKHKPVLFLRSESTAAIVSELAKGTDSYLLAPVNTQLGRNGGTYVCKQLVYTYAMWISPAFHLKVVEFFDRGQTQGVAVAEHAAADFLKNPIPFVEILLDQAKKLQAECEVLESKLAVAEKELNLVTVDEYRALTHRYMPQGMKIKLGRKATAIMREKGMEVVKQERVLGERVCSVNVYPRHILEQAEQLIASN